MSVMMSVSLVSGMVVVRLGRMMMMMMSGLILAWLTLAVTVVQEGLARVGVTPR